MRNLASFKTSFNVEPPAFDNVVRNPNSETKVQCCDRPMAWPEKALLSVRTPPEIARENALNRP